MLIHTRSQPASIIVRFVFQHKLGASEDIFQERRPNVVMRKAVFATRHNQSALRLKIVCHGYDSSLELSRLKYNIRRL